MIAQASQTALTAAAARAAHLIVDREPRIFADTLAEGLLGERVMDYLLPAELRDPAGQMYAELVGAMTAEHGEPWLTFLTPAQAGDLLTECGFDAVRSVGQRDGLPDDLWHRDDALRPAALAMIAHATVAARAGR